MLYRYTVLHRNRILWASEEPICTEGEALDVLRRVVLLRLVEVKQEIARGADRSYVMVMDGLDFRVEPVR